MKVNDFIKTEGELDVKAFEELQVEQSFIFQMVM